MKTTIITGILTALLSVLTLSSCAGRRADNTPNGETVEVVLEPTVALDTLSGSEDKEEHEEVSVSANTSVKPETSVGTTGE